MPGCHFNPFGYKGQAGYVSLSNFDNRPDLNNGLIYYHHRYYDPLSGRWIS